MIERLLAADEALARGDLDLAERLFRQTTEADARNAIAAVGMGRVAAARDDADGARAWFQRALEIDPQEAAARRLLAALEREMAAMGAPAEAPPGAVIEPRVAPRVAQAPIEPAPATPAATEPPQRRRSLLGRLLRWLGLSHDRA